jgi:hypothetical protein
VKLPASVEAMATMSHARCGLAELAINGFKNRHGGDIARRRRDGLSDDSRVLPSSCRRAAMVSALVKFSGSRSDHAWASHALPAKFFEIDQWLPLCKMIGAEERHG